MLYTFAFTNYKQNEQENVFVDKTLYWPFCSSYYVCIHWLARQLLKASLEYVSLLVCLTCTLSVEVLGRWMCEL